MLFSIQHNAQWTSYFYDDKEWASYFANRKKGGNMADNSIVSLASKEAKGIRKLAQQEFMEDSKKVFMTEVKALLGNKMHLQRRITDCEKRIEHIDRQLAAIDAGEATFDLARGVVIWPRGLETDRTTI
jgi:hypothetical protein